jgi:SsrA-binding protein
MAKKKISDNTIALNRKAGHDFELGQQFEAGLVLEGWEVKALRAGRMQLQDSYVVMRKGEAWLINAQITPLQAASTHVNADPHRSRKCLLHNKELVKLFANVQLKGLSIVPLSLYWKRNRVKLKIALAQGKKHFDKRQSKKDQDWKRQKQRGFKQAG